MLMVSSVSSLNYSQRNSRLGSSTRSSVPITGGNQVIGSSCPSNQNQNVLRKFAYMPSFKSKSTLAENILNYSKEYVKQLPGLDVYLNHGIGVIKKTNPAKGSEEFMMSAHSISFIRKNPEGQVIKEYKIYKNENPNGTVSPSYLKINTAQQDGTMKPKYFNYDGRGKLIVNTVLKMMQEKFDKFINM